MIDLLNDIGNGYNKEYRVFASKFKIFIIFLDYVIIDLN